MEELEQTVAERQYTISRLQEKLRVVEQQGRGYAKALAALEAVPEDDEDSGGRDARVEALKNVIVSLQSAAGAQASQLDDASTENTRLEAELAAAEKRAAELEAHLTTANQSATALTAQVRDSAAAPTSKPPTAPELRKLREQLQAAKTSEATAERALKRMEQQAQAAKEEAAQAREKVKQHSTLLAEQAKEAQKWETKFSEVSEQFAEVDAAEYKRLKGLEPTHKKLDADLKAKTAEAQQRTTEIQRLRAESLKEKAALVQEAQEQSKKLKTVQDQVAAGAAEVEAHKARAAALQKQLDQAQLQAKAAETKLAAEKKTLSQRADQAQALALDYHKQLREVVEDPAKRRRLDVSTGSVASPSARAPVFGSLFTLHKDPGKESTDVG